MTDLSSWILCQAFMDSTFERKTEDFRDNYLSTFFIISRTCDLSFFFYAVVPVVAHPHTASSHHHSSP